MSIVLDAPKIAREVESALPQPWRWTRSDYHRALDLGFFNEDDKIELIEGEIYPKSPQSHKHYSTLGRVAKVLTKVFGRNFSVLEQGPAAINLRSEPEPDIMVVRGDFDEYEDHPDPASIVLVVEVSDSTLAKDRLIKGESYAAAGIQDYWLQNLQDRTLEVRRDPGPRADDPERIVYRSVTIYSEAEEIAPLEAPLSSISVAKLFGK